MSAQRQVVRFGSDMLAQTGKQGIVTPDAHGYYAIVLGAYGAYNSADMFYDLASAKAQFEANTTLMRRLQKGVLFGEYAHPDASQYRSQADFIQRVRHIVEDRVAFHIRALRLEAGHQDQQGRPITVVIGEIKPAGPFGKYVQEALDNPHANAYFSVRSLTMDDVMRRVKYTREIITWDYVVEGGIYNANKYCSPALESANASVEVTQNALWSLVERERKAKLLGLENQVEDYLQMVKTLGWERQHQRNNPPAYSQW